jgi:hypothetical protein
MSEARNSRPTRARVGAASVSTAIKNNTIVPTNDRVVRCSRCGAALTAECSVRLELGPVCRLAASEVAA